MNTLQLPSCARCGAPLPAVPADPDHPEWCAACAARAMDTPGMLPPTVPSSSTRSNLSPWNAPPTAAIPPSGPAVVVETRVFDGLLTGIASGAIAGALWWVIASNAQVGAWHFGAIVVGVIIGQGVLIGSRKGGLASGLIALVVAAITIAVSVYFIDRSITIQQYADAGRTSNIPLWQGFSVAKSVFQGWWDYSHAKVGGWILGAVAAVIVAGWPGRRPVVT